MSLSILLVASLLCSPEDQRTLHGEASDAATESLIHFEAGNYDAARAKLEEAYMLEEWPGYLYARAQIERMSNNCQLALEFYQRFLATDPEPDAVAATEQYIKECQNALRLPVDAGAAGVTAEPSEISSDTRPSPQVAPTTLYKKPQPSRTDRIRWWRDPWGGAFSIVGVAVLSTGAGVYGAALARRSDARDAGSQDSFESQTDRVQILSGIGIGAMAAGSAAIVGGIIRYFVVAKRARSRAR